MATIGLVDLALAPARCGTPARTRGGGCVGHGESPSGGRLLQRLPGASRRLRVSCLLVTRPTSLVTKPNLACDKANLAGDKANLAGDKANLAGDKANLAGDTIRVRPPSEMAPPRVDTFWLLLSPSPSPVLVKLARRAPLTSSPPPHPRKRVYRETHAICRLPLGSAHLPARAAARRRSDALAGSSAAYYCSIHDVNLDVLDLAQTTVVALTSRSLDLPCRQLKSCQMTKTSAPPLPTSGLQHLLRKLQQCGQPWRTRRRPSATICVKKWLSALLSSKPCLMSR